MNQKRILIVDDEASMRFLLSKQLKRAGYETATAADGEAAIAAANNTSFDAIVLDVVMPGIDGFEVCRRLKADPRTVDVPVLFLSASSSGEFRRRAFSVGAADFLAKPYQIELLPDFLQATLRRADVTGPTTGRVVSVIGSSRPADAATTATRLAETTALKESGAVMLIDLELPAGSIGARLQLSGGPNMRVLLQDTGEPISDDSIDRVAQRYHGALEVMPAPFSPSFIGQSEPLPHRLNDVLDNLVARGYTVVVHLGSRINDLALTALHHSETILTVSADGAKAEYKALLDQLAAAGLHERVRQQADKTMPAPAVSAQRAGQAHGQQQTRVKKQAPNRLPVAA